MLEINKVYRNIDLRDKFFGFEFIDAIILALAFNLCTFLSGRFLLSLVAAALIACGIRIFKINKPRGYMRDFFRFLFKDRRWSNAA